MCLPAGEWTWEHHDESIYTITIVSSNYKYSSHFLTRPGILNNLLGPLRTVLGWVDAAVVVELYTLLLFI